MNLKTSEHFQQHRMTATDNLTRIHRHIDTFYPLTGVDPVTREANEVTRMFLKSLIRIEGSGSVHVPSDDLLNGNFRQKISYFLEHMSKGDTNHGMYRVAERGRTILRFRHPQELDYSHLVSYNNEGEITGVHNHAPAAMFDSDSSLVIPNEDGTVHLSPLEKLFICFKANTNPLRDLVHVFSCNHHYNIFDGNKLLHEGHRWDGIQNVNHHKTTRESIEYLQAALAKAHTALARHPGDPKIDLVKILVRSYDTTRDSEANRRHSKSIIANPKGARRQLKVFHPDRKHTLTSERGSQPHSRLKPLRTSYKSNNHPLGHPEHNRPLNSIRSDDPEWRNVPQTRGYQNQPGEAPHALPRPILQTNLYDKNSGNNRIFIENVLILHHNCAVYYMFLNIKIFDV